MIQELIREAVLELRDESLWEEALAQEEQEREEMERFAESWEA